MVHVVLLKVLFPAACDAKAESEGKLFFCWRVVDGKRLATSTDGFKCMAKTSLIYAIFQLFASNRHHKTSRLRQHEEPGKAESIWAR